MDCTFAIRVLPVPGGPVNKIPFGMLYPILATSGNLEGSLTNSERNRFCSTNPPMVEKFGSFLRIQQILLPHTISVELSIMKGCSEFAAHFSTLNSKFLTSPLGISNVIFSNTMLC